MTIYKRNESDKYVTTIVEMLRPMIERKISDLHLVAGAPPCYRVDTDLEQQDLPKLTPENLNYLLSDILSPVEWERLDKDMELDFSFSIPGVARYRGNVMKQRGSHAVVFRAVPYETPQFKTLGLPDSVRELCDLKRGLVLVTGPTGSGKSTTLAAMVDIINRTRKLNIVTIEDPIEYLHRHKKSTVRQREIGADTHSFGKALRHVLRHDPDVILIGEMRDLESIKIALTAAETGHLVFSTLHTQTAPLTINRIIDVFGENERKQIRQQIASTIQGVVSQQLMTKKGGGRIVACEVMKGVPAIRNLIREGKEHQLYSVMQTGQEYGMWTMDYALVDLYKKGKIAETTLYENCIDKAEIERVLDQKGHFSSEGLGDW
ncbi:MAG: type IV pilus twitching motility protein PilT [Clostridiales bacterium]|nr:type IV pilus twitching motility protein PilT [Clostridiales bacterium]